MAQQIQPKTSKIIKLINQGTFGCVFRPGLKCGTKTIDSDQYITKVQVDSAEVNRETELGKIITKIPKYQYRFAPIIESCPIDISTIGSTEIKKCEVITNSTDEKTRARFVSNRIKYAGKNTLGDYLGNLLTTSNHSLMSKNVGAYFTKIIDSHIYLLQSLQLLVNQSIVHYDLKENNIMYDDINQTPIIIDFGLSFQINKLTEANYADAFYTLYAQYSCWCIEITLLCYITKRIYKNKTESPKSLIKKAAIDEIKEHISSYLMENEGVKQFITEKEKELFKIKIVKFVNSFHQKTWKQFMDALINTHKTWDNYALSVIMIRELSYSDIINQNPNISFIKEYLGILKAVILAPPTQRQELLITTGAIKTVFAKINKMEYTLFKNQTGRYLKHHNSIQKIKKIRTEASLSQLLEDKELKNRKK